MIGIVPRSVLAAACLMTAACAGKMTSEVTRFHELTAPAGETIQIVHVDPEASRSLEFQDIAQLVGARFGTLGYRPSPPGAVPDIVVKLDYGVVPGPGRAEDGGPRTTVGVGVGSHGGGISIGISGLLGGSAEDAPLFVRSLEMVMVRQSDTSIVFEGRAVSLGKNKVLGDIMPFLVDGMFQDFPGDSGATTRHSVEVPHK